MAGKRTWVPSPGPQGRKRGKGKGKGGEEREGNERKVKGKRREERGRERGRERRRGEGSKRDFPELNLLTGVVRKHQETRKNLRTNSPEFARTIHPRRD